MVMKVRLTLAQCRSHLILDVMETSAIQRRHVIRIVLQQARDTGDAVAPWRGVEGADVFFSGDADVLGALHREWLRALVARLHRGAVVADRSPLQVREVYDETCAENPTLRLILDTHQADPSLWDSTAAEHAMLARLAGLVEDRTPAEVAASAGRDLLLQRIPEQRAAQA